MWLGKLIAGWLLVALVVLVGCSMLLALANLHDRVALLELNQDNLIEVVGMLMEDNLREREDRLYRGEPGPAYPEALPPSPENPTVLEDIEGWPVVGVSCRYTAPGPQVSSWYPVASCGPDGPRRKAGA